MLPVELANLVLHYLNKKYFLLLTNLIKLVNDFYFENLYFLSKHTQAIITSFSKFTNIVVTEDQTFHNNKFIKLDIVKDGNIGKNFICNFILAYLTSINQFSTNVVINQTMLINQILYNFKFNNYLVLLYNDQTNKLLIQWFDKLIEK